METPSRISLSPILSASALALLLILAAHPAAAAPTYCNDVGGNTDGLSTSDMTYNGSNANDCYGVVSGNINQTSDLNGLNLTWGTDWTLLATDEAGSNTGTFMGIDFVLVTSGPATSGTWTLTGTVADPSDLPATLDFVGALKASDAYALYLFDDVVFDGIDGGTWNIAFTNPGGQIPDLSHLALFVREGDGGGGGGGGGGGIPEPASLLLIGAGLIGFGLARRRKSA